MITEPPTNFLRNIANSRKLIGNRYSDYWLNADGTVTAKKYWLARFIRWIQNLCFNKTISDTWSIFQKTIETLEKKRFRLEEEDRRALRFVAKFFRELKPELNRLLKADPKKLEFLESRLQTECGDALENALITVYAESRFVNRETLQKAPLTEKTGEATGDIQDLKDVYDEIPLEKKSLELFIKTLESTGFENALIESIDFFLKTEEIQAKTSFEKFALEKKENKWGPKELSDFFSIIKNFLKSHLEKKSDQGFPIEMYFDMIINKALLQLDSTRSLLMCYEESKKRDLFHSFIDRVRKRDLTVPGATKENAEAYYGQIEFYLKKILQALPKKKRFTLQIHPKEPLRIKRENIYNSLKELAEASELCFAAWVWECGEQCRLLKIDFPENKSFEEIEQHLLKESHHLKESLIVESINNDEAVHYLNGFKCSAEGKDLGFTDEFASKDPFRVQLNAKQAALLKNHVIAEYPKSLLEKIKKSYEIFGTNTAPTTQTSMKILEKHKILNF